MLLSRALFFLLLFLLLPFNVIANNSSLTFSNEYSIELLTENEGFVSSQIYSIIQDKQGLLWFGTGESGLMRYDGRKVDLLEFDTQNPDGLSHNDAGNLFLDKSGDIWIGTWGGGANKYQPELGKFSHFIHEPDRNDSIASNRIQSIFRDSENILWLGSYADGLSRFQGNNKFSRFTANDNSGLSHNRIWDIENKGSKKLWVATSYGLNVFDKARETFSYYLPEPNNLTPTGANEIRNILKTTSSELYIGTQVGLYMFNDSTKVFIEILFEDSKPIGQVNSMIEASDGYLWFVASQGLFRLDQKKKQLEKFPLAKANGLRIIFEDNAGILWLTSEVNGIYKIMPHRKFKAINHQELLAPNGITVDSNGDILIVSAKSQLFKWHVATAQLESLTESIFTQESGFNNRLLERPTVYQDDNDTIWIAQDNGIARYTPQNKQVEILRYPTSDKGYQEFRELRALNSDKHGNIWIGTYKNGIYIFDPLNQTFKHLDESSTLTHPEVLGIYKDNAGNLWVGTGDGLNFWDDVNNVFIPYVESHSKSNSLQGASVQDFHHSESGDIWVATPKGLNLFVPETKTFKHFGRKEGLPTPLIRAIEDDGEGNLWLTTNKGISKLNPKLNVITNFDSYDGLFGLHYYPGDIVQGSNETLFTSSQRGVEYFSARDIEASNKEFQIVLTGFSKMGESILLDKPYSYVSDIHLSYEDYFVSFEFSVLDFTSPNKNQFAYKLDGYDDSWIEIGNRNVVSFTNLNGGEYTFLVKATNSHGKWSESPLAIKIHVSPQPWKTWWAYSLYVLSLLLITSAFIYYRTRQQRNEISRQKQFVMALEEQVDEKTASLNEQAKDLLLANKKLEMLTYQDGLTGLYNRRYFDQVLVTEVNRHAREQQPLSLIMCDIDHFKFFNDYYGHLAGDNCLKEVAQCIQKCAGRISDASCRYGGEEFAVILANTNEEQSTLLAERIREAIEDIKIPHAKSPTSRYITLTVGVVTLIPKVDFTVYDVINSADKALYYGKNHGRNRTSRYDMAEFN
ncbi:diguanylate cyclase [Litorilituus lipolyticus]|uniref:diguanylate cyclase n=1 Tax=Litorilituus lipolyticus TaxID=2491017 RepID=A0A502LDK1_9GAMM|nr:diguanylate cyclase [Litorilituus lipolyticus]